MYIKKKFTNLFDIGVLSVHSANQISNEMNVIFKDKAKVYVETADYLVMFKPEQKTLYKEKINEKVKTAGWKDIKDQTYSHHMVFEVNK